MSNPLRNHISAQDGPITVTYSQLGTEPVTESFDWLVVACDPNLLPLDQDDGQPPSPFKSLKHYQIHCTILNVGAAGKDVPYGIVLSPDTVSRMDGTIYGFRNETAKQYDLVTARGMDRNLVAVYQLRDPFQTPNAPDWSAEKFRSVMLGELPTLPWWPYGSDFDTHPVAEFTTDYFDHFGPKHLEEGRPWDILNLQGQKNTIYVHASTCFESVLHCWQYANLLFDARHGRGLKLPEDPQSRILIVGAGVSGLLFAERLFVKGYKNVRVMEKLPDDTNATGDRYGKTQTVICDAPRPTNPKAPHAAEATIAELGTCYLSVAYEELADYLQKTYVRNGNERRSFTVGDPHQPDFRGMVVPPDLPHFANKTIGFSDYVLLRAQQMLGWSDPSLSELRRLEAKVEIAVAAVRFLIKRAEYFGRHDPMPVNNDVKWSKLGVSFHDYLMDNDMAALVGVMEYAYAIQGYGPLKGISAYYGLVWISDTLVERMIRDELRGESLITYWSLGWGDVWRQMVEAITAKGTVRIDQDVTITSISRHAT